MEELIEAARFVFEWDPDNGINQFIPFNFTEIAYAA
jgi:hypothetical protein